MRIFAVCLLTVIFTINAYAISENAKIQLLLNSIEKSNLTFIRNGTSYTSQEARKHLEMKLNRSWVKIDTAQKFIQNIATKSYLSGHFYMIQLPDGSKIKTADWLNKRLQEIENNGTFN